MADGTKSEIDTYMFMKKKKYFKMKIFFFETALTVASKYVL